MSLKEHAVLSDITNTSNRSPLTTQSDTTHFEPLDNSMSTLFNENMFVYALCHVNKFNNEPSKYTLLSGFIFLYLTHQQRPPSIFFYGNPIDMPATASSAPLTILSLTKSEFIESGYQKKAVVVVDENIYASLLKEKERDCLSNSPQQFKDILLWPGDCHFVKHLFIIIGEFISGS
ncbi:unnamed protein product, partial [Didymodactylos carnosus]